MPTASEAAVVLTASSAARPAHLSSSRIPELDGLRGLAILLVILCHYVGNAQHASLGLWPHRALSAFSAGWSGVDLFFVLSGFLIGGILLDARDAPHFFRTFYLRRVHRILPVYYLWLAIFSTLAVGAMWLLPNRFPVVANDLTQLPYYLLFLQNMKYALTRFQWILLGVTWSLAVEEQFYLLAPPVIRFVSKRRLVYGLLATICLSPMLRFAALRFMTNGSFVAAFAMPCRADALAFGVLLAVAWRTERFRQYWSDHKSLLQTILFVLFLGALALVWWLAHPLGVVTALLGYSWLALFFSGLLLLVLQQTRGWIASFMRWRVLRALGTISYCVYILHAAFNELAHRLFFHASPEINDLKGVSVSLLALAVTLMLAGISWRYYEKPLLRRGHLYSYW